MRGALTRYRIMANIVGVLLIVLVVIAVPLHYVWHHPWLSETAGVVHGFLYPVFLLATLDLTLRCRLPLTRAVVIAVLGTVPFLSFVSEHRTTRFVQALMAERRETADVA